MNIQNIDVSTVMAVYSGNAKGCRCGCKGIYRYSEAHRYAAETDRGYKINDHEVNDKHIKHVVKLIKENASIARIVDDQTVNITLGKKAYTLYLEPATYLNQSDQSFSHT